MGRRGDEYTRGCVIEEKIHGRKKQEGKKDPYKRQQKILEQIKTRYIKRLLKLH